MANEGGYRAMSREQTFSHRHIALAVAPPQGHSMRIVILIPWPLNMAKGCEPRLKLFLMAKSLLIIATKMAR